MNFLKKFGSAILKITQIVTGMGPIFAQAVPQASGTITVVTSELQQLAGVIGTVEAIGQTLSLPGTQKAQAAGPLVAQVILQSTFMAGKKIADEALFTKACTALGGDIADLLNSLHDSAVQTENKA